MGNILFSFQRFCSGDGPFPAPDQDCFYNVPRDVARYKNGHILGTRSAPMPIALLGPCCGEVVQLKYKYTAAFDIADATIVTLVKPRAGFQRFGQRKVVVLALPEDSVALQYAPSYAISSPTASPMSHTLFPNLTVLSALSKGWHVAIPDQEGSKSAWSSRDTEGHATLDAMRAVLTYQNSDPSKTDFVLHGYSGGARTVCAAAELAETYAPELVPSILSCIAGGLVADLQSTARHLDGTAAAGLAIAGAAGLANIPPDLAAFFNEKLTEEGRAVLGQLERGEIGAPNYDKLPGMSLSELTTVPDVFADPAFTGEYGSELLGSGELPPVRGFPIYLVHAQNDPIVPLEQAKAYAERQAKRGTQVILVTPKVPVPLSGGSAHLLASYLAHATFVWAMITAFEGGRQQVCSSAVGLQHKSQESSRGSDTLPIAATLSVRLVLIIGLEASVELQAKLKRFQLEEADRIELASWWFTY